DGDPSNTTLTINIGDSTPTVTVPTAGQAGTSVNEAGLPARGAEPEGSGEEAAAGPNGDPSETTAGPVTFTPRRPPSTLPHQRTSNHRHWTDDHRQLRHANSHQHQPGGVGRLQLHAGRQYLRRYHS